MKVTKEMILAALESMYNSGDYRWQDAGNPATLYKEMRKAIRAALGASEAGKLSKRLRK